jgi:hypothetical protein
MFYFSNPTGSSFDKDGIPQRSTDPLSGNYPNKDRPQNI